jgi:type VII secretion integral membrane protein EccD
VWCLHLFVDRNLWALTALIWLAMLGLPASLAFVLGGVSPLVLGVVLATTSVITIYLAPRIAILVSRLSVPRVPTAGEPLDDIETQAGPTVEGVNAVRAANVGRQVIPTEQGMDDQVRRARSHLTGIVVAAAAMVNVGSYLALDVESGFAWQRVAFVVAIAVMACLRGRGHHDVVQSAVLIVCGLVNGLVLIVTVATYVTDQQVNAGLALIGLTILVAGCGLAAPRLDFSPVTRRRVEIVECLAIASLIPLACWIIGVFAFCRGLRI